MIFQVGMTYGGYTVEARTACFVKFAGVSRKKISMSADGIEQVKFDGVTRIYGDGSSTKIEAFTIAAFEEVEEVESTEPATEFFIPVVAVYDNRTAKALPADHAHAMATPYRAPAVDYSEVEIMAASLGYSILNMGTLKKPMYRLMRDGLLIESRLYGMGLALFDVRAYLEAERHSLRHDIHVESALEKQWCPVKGMITAVIRDIPNCGYAKAIRAYPEWFYDDSNAHEFDLDFERERMQSMFDRDCDRVAHFGVSARYGCGAVLS